MGSGVGGQGAGQVPSLVILLGLEASTAAVARVVVDVGKVAVDMQAKLQVASLKDLSHHLSANKSVLNFWRQRAINRGWKGVFYICGLNTSGLPANLAPI